MKPTALLFLLCALAQPGDSPQAAISYFSNVRDVRVAQNDRQNYFVVDQELWQHSRRDLADLRLFDGEVPVQYALWEQSAGISSEEASAKILNLGGVSGHTEFDLDAQGIAEYDRIRLRLDAHDFVATASVWGGNAPGKAAEVELAPSTLYDFTKEQLGSNFQLKLQPVSFRYLHIRLSAGIGPEQVKGATISNLREQRASWVKVGSCAAPLQKQRLTAITCTVPPRVPLNRVAIDVAPGQVNFRRVVSIEDATGLQIAVGEISRVRVNRGGTLVTNETLVVDVNSGGGQFTVNIDNADNPPLAITGAQPLQLEHRVYFDPQGKADLKLYYGDAKLSPPVYDYARFFHVEPTASEAQLGTGTRNSQYMPRPDERPWSERHKAILWGAMLLAAFALAVLAVRGLRTATPR